MAMIISPLTTEDLTSLQPLDASYCRRAGCEPLVDDASLSFYSRTGHSFVLRADGEVSGFLLAQAIWNGRRPTVTVGRLAASHSGGATALLQALTKSAYDAGVYDIVVERPEGDEEADVTLAACGYQRLPVRLYARVLGSRSRDRPAGEPSGSTGERRIG